MKELRESISKAEKKHRQSIEKYSAALAWIVTVRTAWDGLKVRLAVVEFEHGEIPPISEIIEADLPIEPVD